MKNSSLIEILRTFTPEENLRFDAFVSSAYFNKKSAVTKLWSEVKHYYPKYDSPELDREKVYEKIFPGNKYNYGTYKNLVFDLTKLAEKFLAVEKMLADNFQSGIYLLNQLREKSLGNLFSQKYRSIEKSIKESGSFGDRYKMLLEMTEEKIML